MVRNGESCSLLLVLPNRGWFCLREYCAVAKNFFETTPFQFVTNRLPGVFCVSTAVGSIVIGSEGLTLSWLRSMYCNCSVWLAIGDAVSFTSQRYCSSC